ncbi:hypothetical protein H0H93_016189 [Arthromyces matolae]|nr:hypothetical protein H0H93_016189 [Arthromyces matolae]
MPTFRVIGTFKAKTSQDWIAVLDLATRWKFKDIRDLSVKELAKFELDPLEKIELQQRYDIRPQWAWSAFNALCSRTNGLNVGEGKRLGVETIIKISAVREKLEKWGRKKPEEYMLGAARFFTTSSARRAAEKLVTTRPPLFQRRTPWWARWTWGLIACSVIELTWNHWSVLEGDQDKSAKDIKGDDTPTPDKYVLRPAWQRVAVCTTHMIFGAGLAGALLIAQTRFVRTLAILPASEKESRRVFLQCAHNWAKRGMLYPLNRCRLENGRNPSELILRVTGERGHWYIGLVDCDIDGKRITGPEASAEVLAAWDGKPTGNSRLRPKLEVDQRWKNGPVLRR